MLLTNIWNIFYWLRSVLSYQRILFWKSAKIILKALTTAKAFPALLVCYLFAIPCCILSRSYFPAHFSRHKTGCFGFLYSVIKRGPLPWRISSQSGSINPEALPMVTRFSRFSISWLHFSRPFFPALLPAPSGYDWFIL